MAALLGFFGARFTGVAQLQAGLNDAFRTLMDEWQTERAQHIARISELESEVLRQRGAINAGIQREQSLLRLLERHEIEVPGDYGHAMDAQRRKR